MQFWNHRVQKWVQINKKASAAIGLSMPEELLKHVRGAWTAKKMLEGTYDVS